MGRDSGRVACRWGRADRRDHSYADADAPDHDVAIMLMHVSFPMSDTIPFLQATYCMELSNSWLSYTVTSQELLWILLLQ